MKAALYLVRSTYLSHGYLDVTVEHTLLRHSVLVSDAREPGQSAYDLDMSLGTRNNATTPCP